MLYIKEQAHSEIVQLVRTFEASESRLLTEAEAQIEITLFARSLSI